MNPAIAPCNSYHPHEVRRSIEQCLSAIGWTPPSGARVLVKPNALGAYLPEQATGTHPAVLDAVCAILGDAGNTLAIGDSSAYWFPGYTRRAFETLGLAEVARKHRAEIIAFEEQRYRHVRRPHWPAAPLLRIADLDEFDLVVNVPKLKVHRVARLSAATKNVFGLVPGGAKQLFHEALKDLPDYHDQLGALILDMYRAVRPGLSVLDAVVSLERDGPASNGDPRRTRFVMAGTDALALDVAACGVIGESVAAVPYLREAVRQGEIDPAEVTLLGQPPSTGFVLLEDQGRPGRIERRAKAFIFRNMLVRPEVNGKKCISCGECAAKCQEGAISVDRDLRIRFDMDRCSLCYACPSFCQQGALFLKPSPVGRALLRVRQATGM